MRDWSNIYVLAGILICTAIMTFDVGLLPYWSAQGMPWPSKYDKFFSLFLFFGLPFLGGFSLGVLIGGGMKRRIQAGVLPMIIPIITYSLVLDLTHSDGIVPPVMGLFLVGLGSVGGAASDLLNRLR